MQQDQNVKLKDREKIELFFSARGLANLDVVTDSDPQLFVYLKEGKDGHEKLIGKTEVRKNNLNPDWKTSVVLNFIFEVNQYLRFVVIDSDEGDFDADDEIGTLETTVGQIMGSRNQVFMGVLQHKNKERGKLIVKADRRMEVGESNPLIYWQWYGKKIKNMDGWFGTSDPFLRFLKSHHNQDWLLVHETEYIKDNENPVWRGFEIPHDKLHDENPLQPFKIELWDHEKNGKHQFIGAILVTIDQIIFKEQMQFEVKTNKGEFGGFIGIKTMIKPSLIDYLKGGEQINLSIAIDFTGSNGDPHSSSSLHYNNPPHLNQYQNALLQVSEILLHYDYDKRVPLYGFGGVPRLPNYNKSSTEHCFPLNGQKSDPEVFGLDGIMNTYANALNHVSLSGPTIFGPVLESAIHNAEKNKKKDIYNVLLILTDGQIDDMNECLNLIKKAVKLPLSIIIVGVGNANFSMMQRLDGDDGDVNDVSRDLVQFVPFSKCSQHPGDLAKELLAELPDQLIQYKQSIGKEPNPPKDIDISKL